MGLSDEGEENVEARFDELCLDLNMDKKAKEEAWKSYEKIRTNYTLEVGYFHFSHFCSVSRLQIIYFRILCLVFLTARIYLVIN